MDDQKTAYLELYKEQCTHGRHIESQRQTMASMLLVFAGGLLAADATLRFSIFTFPLSLGVCLLACAGYRLITIFGNKWDETRKRRDDYRMKLLAIETERDQTNGTPDSHGTASHGMLRRGWRTIFVFTGIVGILALAITFAQICLKERACPAPEQPLSLAAQLADCGARSTK